MKAQSFRMTLFCLCSLLVLAPCAANSDTAKKDKGDLDTATTGSSRATVGAAKSPIRTQSTGSGATAGLSTIAHPGFSDAATGSSIGSKSNTKSGATEDNNSFAKSTKGVKGAESAATKPSVKAQPALSGAATQPALQAHPGINDAATGAENSLQTVHSVSSNSR